MSKIKLRERMNLDGRILARSEIKNFEKAKVSLMASSRREDLKNSLDTDIDLTEEQIKQVKEYWKKYEFALEPPLECFKTYFNRTGIFDPRFITYRFRKMFEPYFAPDNYRYALQDKAYLPKIFSKGRQPMAIIRKSNGIILDGDYNKISKEEATKICYDFISTGKEMVIKANASSGGGNTLVFVKDKTLKEVEKILTTYRSDYTVQESVIQHPTLAALNQSTVNTIRLTTFLLNGEVVPLGALIKIGNANVRVDGYKHDGRMMGIDMETGRTLNWILDSKYNRDSVLPSGVDVSDNGIEIPFFKDLVKMAINCHYEVSKIRMIGWDIAVDENGPIIIEANFSNDFRMHQLLTGPLFGQYTEKILDEFLLKKFFVPRMNFNYTYKEYVDYVAITGYLGSKKKVVIPETINGKPVKKLEESAFKRSKFTQEIFVPDSVKSIGMRCFYHCKALRTVRLSKNVKRLQRETFANCGKLVKVENIDNIGFIGTNCFYQCKEFKDVNSNFVQM